MRQWAAVVLIGFILSACGGQPQQLPTLIPTGAPAIATETSAASATTALPTPTVKATDDLEAMEATGQAISAPIQQALAGLADLQGVRTVSSMVLDDGAYVNIDANVAPADDNEDTMGRVLVIVQQ